MTKEELLKCIKEALPHVHRQRIYGKHEQDRIDAEEWLEKWREVHEKRS
jgi:hypothetical protein